MGAGLKPTTLQGAGSLYCIRQAHILDSGTMLPLKRLPYTRGTGGKIRTGILYSSRNPQTLGKATVSCDYNPIHKLTNSHSESAACCNSTQSLLS